jgi:hypothetical protein
LGEGSIEVENGNIKLSAETIASYKEARLIVTAQWQSFQSDLRKTLKPFLPRGIDLQSSAARLSGELGDLLLKYREYQAALLSSATLPTAVRQKYTSALERSRSMFQEIGVRADRVDALRAALLELHTRHPLLERLSAGEVFRVLLDRSPASLFQVLGGTERLEIVYDTPIAIPLICANLFGVVADRHTLAAARCGEIARGAGADQLLPDVYLEECAAHLIDAGSYAPVIDSLGPSELQGSANAYVAYYSRLSDEPFPKFLRSFGYKTPEPEFIPHRDMIASRLRSLFKQYMVAVIHLRRGDARTQKRVEESLAHVYNDTGEESRPEILKRHDARVVQAVIERCAELNAPAQVLVTWDRTLFEANRSLNAEWWCMDPASAADLLALGLPNAPASTAVDMFLMLEPELVRLSGHIWDTIVQFERNNLRDADLMEKAASFKEHFIRNQKPDAARMTQIIAAWKEWKEAEQ